MKLIHTADTHLGGEFALHDMQKAQARKNELRAAFSSLIYWAKTENADLFLITGDLFDSPYPTPDTVDFVLTQLRLIPNCRVIITPGEHDYLAEDGVYNTVTFPENVTIFKKSKLSACRFTTKDGQAITVLGYGFTTPILPTNPFAGLSLEPSDEIRIIACHGELEKENSKLCPITLGEIRESRADYIALGHAHRSSGIKKIDNTYFGYAGSLEGWNFRDLGERGAYKLEITKSEGVATCRPAFFRLSKRIYATETLDLSGKIGQNAILSTITERLKSKGYGSDTLLRLTLTGEVLPEAELTTKALAEALSTLYYCEIVDHTVPKFDLAVFKKDPTVKGELVRTLLPLLESENEEERLYASRALKYALIALAGGELGD